MKQHCLILIGILFSVHLFAQTGIGTTTPNASAKLDVYATNKGFLPPRVTLTSITDVTTIASPAEGLLVYNVGSVGLQAGYYYWNGGNWATIATATSAGNGVTAMDMVKLYGEAWSSATNKIGNSNGYSFTVPVSGRYLFDFSSLTYGGTSFTINFYVRQGITNLGSDGQVSTNNGVRVEYNGKVEVNLQAGITYNVYVTSTNPNRGAEDYDRVYYKLVAGNLPVTGQTVEYGIARYSGADGGALSATSQVPFDATAAGNLNWSGNKFTLKANKTYELESSLIIFNTTGGSAARFQIYDYTNSVVLANGMFMSQNGAGTYSPNANTPMKCIVTPVADIQVGVRLLDYYGYAPGIVGNASVNGSTVPVNASYFIAKQIGSSAIVNPWVLSGSDSYNTTGKVGIGTNSPTTILEVTGDTKVSGVLTAGGNAFPTTTGTNGQALTTNGAGAASWNPVPPPGVITAFAGSTAPTGYLLCNGATVSRTTYAALFAIIGTTYGSGDGSTTFAVPDLRSKMIVGVGQGSGLTNRTLASTGGAETKTLAISEMPSHNHSINDPGHAHSQTTVNDDFNNSGGNPPGFSADGAGSRTWNNINSNTTGISINSAGGGTAFNLMNPFIALNYIIKF